MASGSTTRRRQGKAAFIVTKPLQLMIAMSLMDQLGLKADSDILVVDAFASAEDVARRLRKYPGYGSVVFCEDHRKAYRIAQSRHYHHLYIDTDVGLYKYAQLAFIKALYREKIINVYEEGVGTYRNDLYRGARKYFLDLIGAGTYFGGCSLISKIYAYKLEEYNVKLNAPHNRVEEITKPLEQFIFENSAILNDVFNVGELEKVITSSMCYEECHVYLSGWNIDYSIMGELERLPGLKLFKPHPHIKNARKNEGFLSVPAYIPAEILFVNLLEKFKKINVYHHGTSASRYINSNRIHFVNKRISEE